MTRPHAPALWRAAAILIGATVLFSVFFAATKADAHHIEVELTIPVCPYPATIHGHIVNSERIDATIIESSLPEVPVGTIIPPAGYDFDIPVTAATDIDATFRVRWTNGVEGVKSSHLSVDTFPVCATVPPVEPPTEPPVDTPPPTLPPEPSQPPVEPTVPPVEPSATPSAPAVPNACETECDELAATGVDVTIPGLLALSLVLIAAVLMLGRAYNRSKGMKA